jgi:lipopolysaccharide export LptBFGC system permease protein LptF
MRMLSPTLFRYIFFDLFKVFMLANGALAGILSFGGLLRPLTEQGLEAWQVGLLLTYFTPAMTAYSLPVAVLFATTVVYGRLSADNEIVACRASGLSHLSLALPAAILGLLVSLMSALLLLFVVPKYTLKIEHVVYSNFAKIIANDIERKHQIKPPGAQFTVFARSAYVPAQQDPASRDQQVVLRNPTVVSFRNLFPNDPDRAKARLQVPKDIHIASEATIHLRRVPGDDEKFQLTVVLANGTKFPRSLAGAQLGGVGSAEAGPFDVPSPIGENTKFKDIWELRALYAERGKSSKIRGLLAGFIEHDQRFMYLHGVRDDLNDGDGKAVFPAFGGRERVTLERPANGPATFERDGDLFVASSGDPADLGRRVRMTVEQAGQSPIVYDAREAVMNVRPVADVGRVDVAIELKDVEFHNADGTVTGRKTYPYSFGVPMTERIREVAYRSLNEYSIDPDLPREQLAAMQLTPPQKKLVRELTVLKNDIVSESNSRISFAISCLILTFVGCALGMMFRSGNFLSAFAISFVPALIAITLIVAGQRVAGSVPGAYPRADNPIQLGLGLIWSGNAANLLVAIGLWWRLQRQ